MPQSLVLPTSRLSRLSRRSLPTLRSDGGWSPLALRCLLLAGGLAALAGAVWLGEPSAKLRAEPDLAFLLRGMATIKAVIVLAAFAAASGRLGQAIPPRVAAAYLGGCWLLAGATALIWQPSFIPQAALVFHGGEFLFLIMAWRDVGRQTRRLQPAALVRAGQPFAAET